MTNPVFWSESGPVETATAALLLLLALILALRAAREPSLWHLPVIAALLFARELDLDKAVEPGLLKARTYRGDAPLAVKLLGAAVIVVALVALWRLVRRGWAPFRAAWGEGRAWPVLVVVAVAAVGVAKTIDGAPRKLAPYGVEVSLALEERLIRVEETLELGFAALLVGATLAAWRAARHSGTRHA